MASASSHLPRPRALKTPDHAEVFKLHDVVFARHQLKIAGGLAADIKHPDFHAFGMNGGGEFGIGEIAAVIPVEVAAHGVIEKTVEIQRDVFCPQQHELQV